MITKEKALSSVEINVESNTINVKWVNRIIDDDTVLSEVPHRCSYTAEMIDQFRTDVENAEQYITVVGWE